MNRRALSPLIATVLLIAFAVALGVMIMTWASQLSDSGAGCSEITIEPQKLCYTGDSIDMQLRNTGKIKADGIVIEVSDDIKEVSNKLKSSAIPIGQVLAKEVPYVKTGQDAIVKIKVVINEGNEEIICEDPAYVERNLPNC